MHLVFRLLLQKTEGVQVQTGGEIQIDMVFYKVKRSYCVSPPPPNTHTDTPFPSRHPSIYTRAKGQAARGGGGQEQGGEAAWAGPVTHARGNGWSKPQGDSAQSQTGWPPHHLCMRQILGLQTMCKCVCVSVCVCALQEGTEFMGLYGWFYVELHILRVRTVCYCAAFVWCGSTCVFTLTLKFTKPVCAFACQAVR